MNLRISITVALLAGIALLGMGNKNGRAASQKKGNTGAPGDETSLGQPKTCKNCHNQGPIVASLAISVLDANGQAVTQYQPGASYTARVKVTASGTDLKGYGFQMIALKDDGNTDLDGFTDTNPNNYKIATITNGRTYAEHDNISTSNTFDVAWKAPLAGTGPVTFYASGNGVNSNGTTSGDGAGVAQLKLTEAVSTATDEPGAGGIHIRLQPNPFSEETGLNISGLPAGNYRITAFDLQGNRLWEQLSDEDAAGNNIPVSARNWSPGVYLIRVEGNGILRNVKAVKL